MNIRSIFGKNPPTRIVLCLLGCWLGFIQGYAQFPAYQFSAVSVNQGLSNNQVISLFQDRRGFTWIGTMAGLNRYDGYSCKVFRHHYRDTASLSNNHVNKLFEDPNGRIWVNTIGATNVYDPQTETFTRNPASISQQYGLPPHTYIDIQPSREGVYWFISDTLGLYRYNARLRNVQRIQHSDQDTMSIQTNRITSLREDAQGNVWVIHANGILEQMQKHTHRVAYRNRHLFKEYRGAIQDYQLMVDADGDVWIYGNATMQGVYFLNTRHKTLTRYHTQSSPFRLSSNLVTGLVQDNKGLVWIGLDHGGINLLDKKQGSIGYLMHYPNDDKSLSNNNVTALYKDQAGIIWIGTNKMGVNYYHENIFQFPFYRHQAGNTQSLPYNDVNRFVEDAKGNLWIGTNGGGLLYFNRQNGSYTRYLHDPTDQASLSSNIVVSLCIDHKQQLWIGTYRGGLNRFEKGRFIRYQPDPNRSNSLVNENIWEIFEDSEWNMWIGTNGGGLELFDPDKNAFYHYQAGAINSISSNYITALFEDREKNLWIGTAYGINQKDRKSGRILHYLHREGDSTSLSNNNVTAALEDNRGRIWVGTEEGLTIFNKYSQHFQIIRKEDGLPDNTILGLLEDSNHNLWVSTPNGICHVKVRESAASAPYALTFQHYDERDGLQSKFLNPDVTYRTRSGELIFGGANGFHLFRPEQISLNVLHPTVALTDFQLLNQSVRVGEPISGRVILPQAMPATREIMLDYDQNVFSIEFAAPYYFHPDKTQYAYLLENFSTHWQLTDGKFRKATYTNLNPGEYLFRVKASNSDGNWHQQETRLKITIRPPFWQTRWAYAFYGLLLMGILAYGRTRILKRAQRKFEVERERQESQRTHEMDLMKIHFFTNVSHEFKTPLSLILAPLEKSFQNPQDDLRKQAPMIYRNAKRLLTMVNQLLDFRKMEALQLKLYPTESDIVGFVQEITETFSDISEKKHISLAFHSHLERLSMYFDPDKLEKILFNLLSNAFKFTEDYGRVEVDVELAEPDYPANPDARGQWLQITVSDTGIGIPFDKQEKIFERFFQHETSGILNQGSGIGLAITKEFVRLHEGSIAVESEVNRGSRFILRLPVHKQPDRANSLEEGDLPSTMEQPVLVSTDEQAAGSETQPRPKKVVLLIEDNEDFRFYLKDNLQAHYTILEASNGKEGWQLAVSHLPHLIVSDVAMPKMDGIELCRKIKSNARTAHIRVILLTARDTDEQKLEGFQTGTDDYITKPFNFEILHARIRNLLLPPKKEAKSFEITPRDIHIPSYDEDLLHRVQELVEKNLANPDYSVEELGRDMGMSRGTLYRKLLELTGKPPIEFIRFLRMLRAAQLLEKSRLSVSEVAYEVGFNNPKYFTKYFKMQYQQLPSQYRTEALKKTVQK